MLLLWKFSDGGYRTDGFLFVQLLKLLFTLCCFVIILAIIPLLQ